MQGTGNYNLQINVPVVHKGSSTLYFYKKITRCKAIFEFYSK